MNKKGFTLIELLAVIVVLALILIIAIPRTLNVIEETEKEAFRITGENLVKAAGDRGIIESMNNPISKTYTITDGEFVGEKIPMSGKLPDNGTIHVSETGEVTIAISNDKWCATKNEDSENVTISEDVENCKLDSEPTPAICFTTSDISATEISITDYEDESCAMDVVIPSIINEKTVTTIGDSAFENYPLTSVTIPNSVISIGEYAFFSNQLTSVTIPNSVTSIGEGAFEYNQLTSVTIPNGLTSIEDFVFESNQLTSVVIPSSVTSIGYTAFEYNQLTSVVIPSSVTSIASCAFYGNQLTSVVIPSSVTSIDAGAFANNQLPDNQAFIYARDSEGNENTSILVSYGGARRDNVVIPNSVTNIAAYAFDGVQLTSVTIPDSVTSIGYTAFRFNQLTNVTLPTNVTYIGDYAFQSNKLTSVVLPSSVTSIGNWVFEGNQLTSLTLGNGVTYIGDYAFSNNELTSVTIPSNVSVQNSSISLSFYNVYNPNKLSGTYTFESQTEVWTKQ